MRIHRLKQESKRTSTSLDVYLMQIYGLHYKKTLINNNLMWKLDYKEIWAQKNWCSWTVVLEKTLESPLHYKEIHPVHPKGNQSWVFIGKTDVEVKLQYFWPPDVKSWLIWKGPDAGKDWGQEEKGMTEDEMVGWHHLFTQWTWVWVNSGSWWWTGKPGVLWFMESQRVRHDWATELNWTDYYCVTINFSFYVC